QAEDGIRDFHVTGVQTCALPISRSTRTPARNTWSTSASSTAHASSQAGGNGRSARAAAVSSSCPGRARFCQPTGSDQAEEAVTRSEERRVGKECRRGGRRRGKKT